MTTRLEKLQQAVAENRAVKAIAGIANFELAHVLKVVRAAQAAGVQAVDVAARVDIVRAVREEAPDMVVFASAIQPEELLNVAKAGADVVELGNFDALYAEGLFFSHDEVLSLAQKTVELINGRALVSVTIPGHLAVSTQTDMAKALEVMGVDFIQTEGAARTLSAEPRVKQLTMAEKAVLTIKNTEALVALNKLPVITASGITAENVNDAFAAGAAMVGVGSAVNKLNDETEMQTVLTHLMEVIATAVETSEKQRFSHVS